MQNVSQEWKDNQNDTLVCESDIEISLRLTDPDAHADATAIDSGHVQFANTNQTVSDGEKRIAPYATMERNLWLLDGSRQIVPDIDYGTVGYIGNEICNESRRYSTNPVVAVHFTQVHRNLLQGVTIRWSDFLDEYATEFIVTIYNGETVVATQTVTDNSSTLSVVMFDIVDYDSILVEVVEWSLAHRRARIGEILIGVQKVFSKNDIFSYDCSLDVDPISAELPKSEISFSIDNLDAEYNPYNIDGLSKYLIERQEITVRYGYKLPYGVEWISGGKYYLSEWDAKQGSIRADFKARDILEFMTGLYYNGVYSPEGVSMYDLADAVLQDVGLPLNADGSVKWVIDESLKDIYTTAPVPIDTHANCLQMIANASESVFYQDRQGFIRIEKIDPTLSDYEISYFNSYAKSGLSLSKPLGKVAVPFYSYAPATVKSLLYSGTMEIIGTKKVLVKYSHPASSVVAWIEGGSIKQVEHNTNSCILTIVASGAVKIDVEGYVISGSSVVTTVDVAADGETVTVDNPLITNQERAIAVGEWVKSYMQNRMTITSDWRADPRLDALDVVENENDYGTKPVLMTNVKYTYNGAFRGSGEGRVI